ncbi:MAG: malonyl-CoA decarboxylase [Deltaproteobacteria bacterium]|nr:malonyl-CoA decarboxylase [Deltaproteobacteria bacterium]
MQRAPAGGSENESAAWSRRIVECLEGPGGEVSARMRAAALAETYTGLDREARHRLLELLAERFGPAPQNVDAAIDRYRASNDDASRITAEAALREALTPPRRRLLTQFNAVEGGVKFLVDLRADLQPIASQSPHLASLDDDLKDLLVSWLDFGFLELARITWSSPAALLEKLIAYEAVHEIRSWQDLHNRLDSDRRCYALFHPSMPSEPLAFVEVALCVGLARSIQPLLDESAPLDDPREADTAIFYSITSPQRGLRGISFGEFLIKRAVDALRRDLPRLEHYATLSPVPGFRVWLESRLAREPEHLHLGEIGRPADAEAVRQVVADRSLLSRDDGPPSLAETLKRLCALYFAERRGDGQPLDPVARFHLRNGARLESINWRADTSPKGIRQSLGLMVNYSYDQSEIDANHEAYAKERCLAVSSGVHRLMQEAGAEPRGIRAIGRAGG